MSTATKTDRVYVTCPECGTDRDVHRETARDIRNGRTSSRCRSCAHSGPRPSRSIEPEPAPTGDWRREAACLGVDPELFFPLGEPGSKSYERAAAPAKAVCAHCPVITDCLEDALQAGDRWAIRGGLDPLERGEQFGQRWRRRKEGGRVSDREYAAWLNRRANCGCLGGCPDCEPREEE